MFGRLTIDQQALVLGLDPLRDPGDFAAFCRIREAASGVDTTVAELLRRAEEADDEHQRIRNLGVPAWDVWATDTDTPAVESLPPDHRVVVADLGGMDSAQQRSVLSAGLLELLWHRRHERRQPQKIHATVLSQCDNLILLRMNSTVDTDHLARVFGFVPPALLRQAAAFQLGEGLVAGRISPHALRYLGARRWTREGGADVPATWASPGG